MRKLLNVGENNDVFNKLECGSFNYVYTNFGIHTMLSNKDKNILTEVPKLGG